MIIFLRTIFALFILQVVLLANVNVLTEYRRSEQKQRLVRGLQLLVQYRPLSLSNPRPRLGHTLLHKEFNKLQQRFVNFTFLLLNCTQRKLTLFMLFILIFCVISIDWITFGTFHQTRFLIWNCTNVAALHEIMLLLAANIINPQKL